MGRDQHQPVPRLPRGLTRVARKGGDRIQLAFTYRGLECRELAPGLNPDRRQDVTQAVGLRAEILRRIAQGTFSYADYFPDSPKIHKLGLLPVRLQMRDLLSDVLKRVAKRVARGKLSPSTAEGYRKLIVGDLVPFFGDYAVSDVDSALVRRWMKGFTCTTKTARNRISVLRGVLDDAVEDGLLSENPVNKIAIKKLLDEVTRGSDFIVDPFVREERDAILEAAAGRDPQLHNLIKFAWWTGLRTSELIALRWDDVDLAKGTVYVHRVRVAKTEKDRTKTPAGTRYVHLLPPARAALEAQKQHTLLMGQHVFYNPRSGKPWHDDKQLRVGHWQPILTDAGVRYRHPYMTRHTYASMLLSKGENELWVAQQMGHASIEMIRHHYGRWIPEKSAGIATAGDYTKAN